MKVMSVLRKLGIVRYGAKASAYKGSADRPYEFMSDDVFNAAEETVTKDDIKSVLGHKDEQVAGGEAKFCPKCGASVRSGAAFCTKCGNVLNRTVATQADKPVSLPPDLPGSVSQPKGPKGRGKLVGAIFVVIGVILGVALLGVGLVSLKNAVASARQQAMEREAERIRMTLEKAVAYGSDTQVPMAPAGIEFKLYENSDVGISFELPKTWDSKHVRGALIFSGPASTEQEKTTINLQLVARSNEASLEKQAEEFVGQLQSSDRFVMEGSALEKVRGARTAFLLVSYDVNSTKFRQLQLIIEREDLYAHLAYTAPAELFDKYLYAMYHSIYNFKFVPIRRISDKSPGDPARNGGLKDLVKSIDDTFQSILGGNTEDKRED